MAGTRSLTLKLLADVDNFTKNLKGADKEVKGFGSSGGLRWQIIDRWR